MLSKSYHQFSHIGLNESELSLEVLLPLSDYMHLVGTSGGCVECGSIGVGLYKVRI